MSYNTYWSGSLEVTPELSKAEVEKLEEWLGHNANERIITDPDVIEKMVMNGWEYHTPWSPIEDFIDRQDLYPGHSYIEVRGDGAYPGIVGIILFHMLKQIHGHIVFGNISWDGDESDDIGEIVVKDDKVFVCTGSIVYEEPSAENEIKSYER